MGAGTTRPIDPNKYAFSYGPIIVKDFADDDAIVIDQEADDYAHYVGLGGEVTLVQQTNEVATVTVRIPESSPANALLHARRVAAKAGLLPKLDSLLAKSDGTTVMGGAKAWIMGAPKQRKFSSTAQVVEWRFGVAKLARVDGFVPEA